jgi:hypothetical protein
MCASARLFVSSLILVLSVWAISWAQAPSPPGAGRMTINEHDNSPLNVSSECLSLFNNKVQYILMNSCANCHATGRGGAFVLMQATDPSGRRSTDANLSAVIRQISFEKPGASPLLVKAGTAHGGAAQAALANRQAVPFATLQGWIEMVAAQNRQLKAYGAAAVTFAPAEETVVNAPAARAVETVPSNTQVPAKDVAEYPFGRQVERVDCTAPVASSVAEHPSGASTEATTPPVSPYDPEPFNRMVHSKN